jgi:hypothetical protein
MSVHEYARRERQRIATAGAYGFRAWLETPAGGEIVLDPAVLGYLEVSTVEELAADYGISYREAQRTISAALAEGN